MKKDRRNVVLLCGFYFLSYLAFVLPYGYMQTFLESVGYDVVERGVILSGTAVVAIVTQLFAGYLCDKYHSCLLYTSLCHFQWKKIYHAVLPYLESFYASRVLLVSFCPSYC